MGYPLFARKTSSFVAAWILQLSHGSSCLASCTAGTCCWHVTLFKFQGRVWGCNGVGGTGEQLGAWG